MTTIIDNNGDYVTSPIHKEFGLTYASFLVVPRLLMEAMPWGWQIDMVDLMEELNEKFDWEKYNETIQISMKNSEGKFTPIDRNLCNYRRGNAEQYRKDSGETV